MVAALGAVLFVVLIRWVMGLIGASTANIDSSVVSRELTYVSSQLERDFSKATTCDPNGLDVPLRHFEAQELRLYADVAGGAGGAGDGVVDLVVWRVAAGFASRGVVAGTGSCSFDLVGLQLKALAANVRMTEPNGSAAVVFTGRRDGAVAAGAGDYGPCTGMDAERCAYSGVGVRLVVLSPGRAVPQILERVYRVQLSSSRL